MAGDAGTPVWPAYGPDRVDPWAGRGWQIPKAGWAYRLMLLAAVVLVALGAARAGRAIGEERRARDQRTSYVAVPGRTVAAPPEAVRPPGGEPGAGATEFEGSAEPFGDVVVPLRSGVPAGQTLTLLVARDDPRDYVLPGARARPGPLLRGLLLTLTAAAALAAAAAALARRRSLDLSQVRAVAARAPETGPPPAADPGPLWRAVLTRATLGLLLAAVAGIAFEHGAGADPVTTVTTQGVVSTTEARPRLEFSDEDGLPAVRYLTGAERARGVRSGEQVPVTYRRHRTFGGADYVLAAVAAAAAAVTTGAALTWPRALRRAARRPPVRADVVTWARRPDRTDWLLVAPAGATTIAEVVAIRLRKDVVPPVALAGPLWIHGTPRRWRAAVVRGPDGTAYWPVTRCAGWFAAAHARVGPAAPVRDGQPGA